MNHLDDFDYEEPRKQKHTEPEVEAPKVSLYDFIVMDKIEAFARCYTPVDHQTETCEVFDDARLREFFKAYVLSLGDPLNLYIMELNALGFQMNVQVSTGQPVIFAEPKY